MIIRMTTRILGCCALMLSMLPVTASAYDVDEVEVAFTATIMLTDQDTGFAMPTLGVFYLFDDGVFCACAEYPIGSVDFDWLKLTDPELFGTWKRALDGFVLTDSARNEQVVSRSSVNVIKGN